MLTHDAVLSLSTPNELFEGEVYVDDVHFGGKPRSGQFRNKARPQDIADKIKLGNNQGAKRSRMSKANFERRRRNRRIVNFVRQVKPGHGTTKTRVFLSLSEDENVANYIAKNCIKMGSIVRTKECPAYHHYSQYFTHETV